MLGNCKDDNDSVMINWYDPLSPDIDLFRLFSDGAAAGTIRASQTYKSQVQYNDPTSVDVLHPDFDSNACGIGDPSSAFFEKGIYCEQKVIPCVVDSSHRGTLDQSEIPTPACAGDCGPGYVLEDGFCVPDCSTVFFDPVEICFPIELEY